MDKTLEKRVIERKNQAIKRKVHEKAKLIAQVLGEQRKSYLRDSGEYFEDKLHHEITANGLYIDYVRDIHRLGCRDESVYIKSERTKEEFYLFISHYEPGKNKELEIKGYVPGDWEANLETLYKEAMAKQKIVKKKEAEKKRQEKIREESELRKKFGL